MMSSATTLSSRTARPSRAFTVIELLVAVSVMTVIVYGLYSMFTHTQRALHENMVQVDILESGRSAMGLMERELEGLSSVPATVFNQTNLFIELGDSEPWAQPLLTDGSYRTNVLQDFFFLTRVNNRWSAIGYHARATNGVATLYRYETNAFTDELARANLSLQFRAGRSQPTRLHPVADGVIHLRLLTYSADGVLLEPASIKRFFPAWVYADVTEDRKPGVSMWPGYPPEVTNQVVKPPASAVFRQGGGGITETRFVGPGLPAYVDVELGILDPKVHERFRALAVNRSAATNFLAKQAGSVHLFRRRIPIRVGQ